MAFWDRVKAWPGRWYQSRKKLVGKISDALQMWIAAGKWKPLVASAWGEFWLRAEAPALEAIRGIRDKEIEVPDGESYKSVYLKVLVPKLTEWLDENSDGSINAAEVIAKIPERWWNRSLEVGLGVVETVDGDMAEDFEEIAKAFRGE